MSKNIKEWQSQKVAELKKLKSISKDQKLLISIFEKKEPSKNELRKLAILFKLEKQIEKHNEELRKIIKEKKALTRKENQKQRKECERNLYCSATVLIQTGIVDSKTGKIAYDFHQIRGGMLAMVDAIAKNKTDVLKKWIALSEELEQAKQTD